MKVLLLLISIIYTFTAMAQDSTPIRTIEVTGTHEMMIDPEWIIFTINIEEYWKEEFEGKKYEEYKTKIDIESIERELVQELKSMDIKMSQITLNQAGNFWRGRGKDFLVSKSLDLKLMSFDKANQLSNQLKTRGIKSMNVVKLDHSNMDEMILKVKKEALIAARKKAEMLAAVYDNVLGNPITIVEIDAFAGIIPPAPMGQLRAKSMAMESAAPSVNYENFKQILIKENVRVLFEIK
jgi:uncharacterized protein YggE